MGRSFHECIVAAAVFLLSALVAGCGSGGGEPAALVPAGSDAVQAQVTKEGGALELTTAGGARLKLTVPPGALHLPATIVLREAAPLSGALATFTIEPAGTRLHLPATLEASFPVEPDPGVSLGAWFGTPDSRTSMPGTYDARRRTYTFQSWFLGYAAIPAPDASAADPKGIEREKLVRSVKDLADPRAAPSGSDFINVGLLSCEIELTSLGERIERAKLLPLSGELASQLISQFKATRDRCQASSIDDEVARTVAVTTQLQALACEKYNAASTTARVLAGATSADEMNAQLKPIIAAAALAMHTGADCASADDLASVLEPEFSDFLDNYIDRVNAPGFLTDDAQIWRQAWAEQVKAYDVAGTAQMLNMESADRQVWTEVLAPILRQLRKIAYAACRDEEFREERFLVDINTGGWLFGHPVVSDPELPPWADFSADDLLRDIQLCASRLTIRTYPPVTEGVEVHEEKTLGGGNAPGTHSATAQMRLVPDGAIHLSGPIHDFTCGNPTGSARPENATVTIMADDHVLGTVSLQGASLQTVPFVASFSTILDTLASPSSQQGAPSRFRLRVLRNGSGCGGTHGPDNFELFSIDFVALEYEEPDPEEYDLTLRWDGTPPITQGTLLRVEAEAACRGYPCRPLAGMRVEAESSLGITRGIRYQKEGPVPQPSTMMVSPDETGRTAFATFTVSVTDDLIYNFDELVVAARLLDENSRVLAERGELIRLRDTRPLRDRLLGTYQVTLVCDPAVYGKGYAQATAEGEQGIRIRWNAVRVSSPPAGSCGDDRYPLSGEVAGTIDEAKHSFIVSDVTAAPCPNPGTYARFDVRTDELDGDWWRIIPTCANIRNQYSMGFVDFPLYGTAIRRLRGGPGWPDIPMP